MRFLVVTKPRTTPPMEMMLPMVEGGEAWHERYEDKFEVFGIFAGGGGFGIVDVEDEAELHRMIMEMPFTPFADVEVRTFVDGKTGWKQVREAIEARLAAA